MRQKKISTPRDFIWDGQNLNSKWLKEIREFFGSCPAKAQGSAGFRLEEVWALKHHIRYEFLSTGPAFVGAGFILRQALPLERLKESH